MKFLRAGKIDATQGNLWKLIFLYAIPLILGTLVQSCFNAVDLIVLGNMADSNAVASVGATTSITSLVVNSFIGIGAGAKIILAHQFGAKNSAQIKRTVDTAILTAVGLGSIIALLGVPFAPGILHLTNCPADCFEGAVIYIRIYVGAAPAILLYNFGSAVLTASGDSQRPLYYIIISGLVNVIMNIILCLILPQKVIAVAASTALSQVVAATLVIRRLCHMEGDGRLILQTIRFHLRSFGQILAQGLPMAFSTALYPFANLQIQSAINTFGVSAIAGNSACATLEGIPGAFCGSFNSTTSVFMGQNLGAGKHDRANQTFRNCMIINITVGLVLGIGMNFIGRFLLRFFLPDDPMGVEYGMIRMFYVCGFYVIACIKGILASAIQTFGYASFSALNSIVWVCGFRFFWMYVIYPHFETFDMLMACFIVSWTLVMIAEFFGYFYFKKRVKSLAEANH